MIDKVAQLLQTSMENVFSTMLQTKVQYVAEGEAPTEESRLVIGSIGITGDFSAIVYIKFGEKSAIDITSRMLGMRPQEIDSPEMVNDAIGELTNMIVGFVKTSLCDQGNPCVMTIPTVFHGAELAIATGTSCMRKVFHSTYEGHFVSVQIISRPARK